MNKTSKTKKRSRATTLKWDIFDPSAAKHIDALQMALTRTGRDTLLPELYEIFGKEATIKFLDIFAGTTVKVPSKQVIENAIRDTFIYLTLKKAKRSYNIKPADVVNDLADRYSIERETVNLIYREMEKFA
jgi:hypothetical protein